jgi:glycosyltransferase involved in cell wall biosynthesis
LLAGLSEWGLAAVTSVSFPTQVDEDEMQMLEIFVHPDMDSDFAGQWIAKAMRAGKPVVACNEQRESEWVIDRETGILVPVNEVNSLANALCWMLYHPQLALAMGMAGRKRVLEFEH